MIELQVLKGSPAWRGDWAEAGRSVSRVLTAIRVKDGGPIAKSGSMEMREVQFLDIR